MNLLSLTRLVAQPKSRAWRPVPLGLMVAVLALQGCERPADAVGRILPPLETEKPPPDAPVAPEAGSTSMPPATSRPVDAGEEPPLPLDDGGHEVSANGSQLLLDGKAITLFGVRAASAAMSEETTQALIDQLDTYRLHGINSVSVSFQGGEAISRDPFTRSGGAIDSVIQARILRIVEALDRRSMVAIVGFLHHSLSDLSLESWDAAELAVTKVARALSPYRNVILNIADKQNAPGHRSLPWADIRIPSRLSHLASFPNQVDPKLLVGAGGTDHATNLKIAAQPDVDVLLFSGGDIAQLSRDFAKLGKPVVCVELYGEWTEQFLPPGVFPDPAKQRYFDDLDTALSGGAVSVFFYSAPWLEGPSVGSYPIRYDLGGLGTESDPGIRWYFDRVQSLRQ